jgi:hypothetical protein
MLTVHEKINLRGKHEKNKAFFNPQDKHNTRQTKGQKKVWNAKLLKKNR